MKALLQRLFYVLFFMAIVSCSSSKSIQNQPKLLGYNNVIPVVKEQSKTAYSTGNNFFIKNKQDLWELYVEGDPLERGWLQEV